MSAEVIFRNEDGEVMKRPATLGDIKTFLKENNGQIDGRAVKAVHTEFDSEFKLVDVEFELEE